MELKFSPVVNLDKQEKIHKIQVNHLPGLHFTRRFANYLVNAYTLGPTSGFDFKFGPKVPNKKNTRLLLF